MPPVLLAATSFIHSTMKMGGFTRLEIEQLARDDGLSEVFFSSTVFSLNFSGRGAP
jgi:hypothetical protein